MRKTLAVLLGLGLLLPTGVFFALKRLLIWGWTGVVWLAGEDQGMTEADLPDEPEWPHCHRIRVQAPLWYADAPDWQERKH